MFCLAIFVVNNFDLLILFTIFGYSILLMKNNPVKGWLYLPLKLFTTKFWFSESEDFWLVKKES
jgi:hypothetical protein